MSSASEKSIFTRDSLVKYDNPILVTTHLTKRSKESTHLRPSKIQSTLPPIDSKQETTEVLHEILPPKEWEDDGKKWIQKVSTTPASRLDVINLQEQLDAQLKVQQARETGLCPKRRKLYSQCFDEIIRQVTINCAERGLLLLRIRDELLMTLRAFETLYQSSIAFGLRKALQSEEGKEGYVETIKELKTKNEELEELTTLIKKKIEYTEIRAAESHEAIEKSHMEEVAFLKKINEQLKAQLEGIVAPRKQ